MGLGQDPCGTSACGLDIQTPGEPRRRTAPAALAFDGTRRDFVLEDDGSYRAAHPVDAKVFLVLRTTLQSIRSAPGIGQGVGLLEYIDPRTIRATVEDRINVALAPFVAAGEIRIERIDIETSNTAGRISFRANYVNLVSGRRVAATP